MNFVADDTEDFLHNHDYKERSAAAVHDDDRKNNVHDHHMEEILDDHIEMLLHIDGEYFGLNVCLTVTDGPCKILHSTDKYGSTLQMNKKNFKLDNPGLIFCTEGSRKPLNRYGSL